MPLAAIAGLPAILLFAVMVPVKVGLSVSVGTLVVSTASVTAPAVPPPVKPNPAVTPVTSFEVFRLRVTLPEVPPPRRSVPAVTPVIVPLPDPGKVCPGAKLIVPSVLKNMPVSAGVPPVALASRLKVAPGLAVLLPVGSACHWKAGKTGVLVEELYELAWKNIGKESKPPELVALPARETFNRPRQMDLPLTSNTAVELGTSPTPMPVALEKRIELPTVVVPVKTGRNPVVPPGGCDVGSWRRERSGW